jgi:hypothetical protein
MDLLDKSVSLALFYTIQIERQLTEATYGVV